VNLLIMIKLRNQDEVSIEYPVLLRNIRNDITDITFPDQSWRYQRRRASELCGNVMEII